MFSCNFSLSRDQLTKNRKHPTTFFMFSDNSMQCKARLFTGHLIITVEGPITSKVDKLKTITKRFLFAITMRN